MTLAALIVTMFCSLGIALSVSAAVSDKMSKDNMRDMTVPGKYRKRI